MKVLLADEVLAINLSIGGTVHCVMDTLVGAASIVPVAVTASNGGDTSLLTGYKRIEAMSIVNSGGAAVSVYLKVDSNRITHKFVLEAEQAAYYANFEWKWSQVGISSEPEVTSADLLDLAQTRTSGDGFKNNGTNGFYPGE